MAHREHIYIDEIIKAVAVYIGEINCHREGACIAQGQAWQGAKMPAAIIEPHSSWRMEVIADIQIRRPITIQIAKGGCKTPIARRLVEWVSFFIQECAVRP